MISGFAAMAARCYIWSQPERINGAGTEDRTWAVSGEENRPIVLRKNRLSHRTSAHLREGAVRAEVGSSTRRGSYQSRVTSVISHLQKLMIEVVTLQHFTDTLQVSPLNGIAECRKSSFRSGQFCCDRVQCSRWVSEAGCRHLGHYMLCLVSDYLEGPSHDVLTREDRRFPEASA